MKPTQTACWPINLSPQSIGDSAFVEWLSQQLVSLAGAASRVALEVSEFGALRNTVALMPVREMARARGVAFGIDHFGLDPQAVQLLRDAAPDYARSSVAHSPRSWWRHRPISTCWCRS